MGDLDTVDILFVITAFSLQIILLLYFALRKWAFDRAMRWGWIVYALALPAALVGGVAWYSGKPYTMWLSALLFTVWAILGYVVDRRLNIPWRNPIRWPVLIPYVTLYLAAQLMYWWGVGFVNRTFWFAYGLLFIISTVLNITSHKSDEKEPTAALQ